jgi:hypothetical protein
MLRRQLGSLVIGLLLGRAAAAQQTAVDSSADRSARTTTEVWAGYSPASTSAGFLGRHDGIKLGLLAMRFNWRVRETRSRSLYYTFDVIPVARVSPLIEYTTSTGATIPSVFECKPPERDCNRISVPARGVGVNPIGWTLLYGSGHRKWRFGATGGILVFDRPAPSDLAAKFNFTAAVEGGMQLMSRAGNGVLLVYRLHHLSNAGTASDNLAMLSHVFSIGATWRTGKR